MVLLVYRAPDNPSTRIFMPVILYHGDNALEISEAVRTARMRFNAADIVRLDGAVVPLGMLSEACRTAGLFDAERLVIVDHLDKRYGGRVADSERQNVAEIIASVAPTTTLILVSPEISGDHQLVRDVRGASGEVRIFSTPKRQDLHRWVVARGSAHGVTVQREAAQALVELVGANAVMLDSEIEKLASYAGEEAQITPEMVDLLVGSVPQESIFTLVDAVAAGNGAEALRLTHRLLATATSTPTDVALYLIRMLARQVRILLRVRLAQQAGKARSKIVDELKLNRYYADRYFRQAQRLSNERLCSSFERLAAFEHALKLGKADPATGLDLLVVELCS
jgi:DNA polymerase III subunit delta